MNILIVNYEFPPVGGGGGRAVYKLARQWARTDSVDYVTLRAGDLKSRENVDGIRLHRVSSLGREDLNAAPIRSLLWYPVSGLLRGMELLSRQRYDVINSHFAVPSGLLGTFLSAICGIPHVASIHGIDIYDPSRWISPHVCFPVGMVVRWVLHRANRVIAQSTDTAQNAQKYYGKDLARKMEIVPLAFDPKEPEKLAGGSSAKLEEMGLSSDSVCLIGVGRLVKRKGFANLIRSLPELPDQVQLLIVGNGPQKEELVRIRTSLGLEKRVVLADHLTDRDKYRFLRAADIFVLPSEHEGFGIVLQEAMSVGLPIVATSHGGQTDLLEDGLNAILIDSSEPKCIAEGIMRLIENRQLRRRMSKANLQHIRDFNPPTIASRYINIFRENVKI
ncbi:MAG: glycosyltransferase family 4 protein [Candidatus Brocadiia bacterium]